MIGFNQENGCGVRCGPTTDQLTDADPQLISSVVVVLLLKESLLDVDGLEDKLMERIVENVEIFV